MQDTCLSMNVSIVPYPEPPNRQHPENEALNNDKPRKTSIRVLRPDTFERNIAMIPQLQ